MNKRRILAIISTVIVVAGAVLLLVLLNGKNEKTDTSMTPTVTPTVAPTDTVAPTSSQADTAAQTRVFDEAGILDDPEKKLLEERIGKLRQKYDFDVVIRIVNMEELKYDMLGAFTNEYYDSGISGRYRFGEDGLLLFLNMCDDEDGRDYWFNGCGKGAVWFDQYFFDLIQNRTDFINYLKRGDYYKAFDEMLDYVNIFLEEATTGEQPYSFDHPYTEVK